MIVGEEEIHIKKKLYYVLMKCGVGNHHKCKSLIKKGAIFVNQIKICNPDFYVCQKDMIEYQNKVLDWPFVYYMMNKPKGYICAHHDRYHLCVMDLFERKDCFCLGRLDKDTTGLLIISNDSALSQKLLRPEYHVYKTYEVTVNKELDHSLIKMFHDGVVIDKNYQCHQAFLSIKDSYHCHVTIDEGKYHQIKKMFMSCGYQVLSLKRIVFADIHLDKNLKQGEYRPLSYSELEKIEKKIS